MKTFKNAARAYSFTLNMPGACAGYFRQTLFKNSNLKSHAAARQLFKQSEATERRFQTAQHSLLILQQIIILFYLTKTLISIVSYHHRQVREYWLSYCLLCSKCHQLFVLFSCLKFSDFGVYWVVLYSGRGNNRRSGISISILVAVWLH